MRLTGFDLGGIKATIALSGRELDLLEDWAERHYDGRCRAAIHHGGFLYGFIQEWTAEHNIHPTHEPDREIEVTVTGDQLGTLAKISEMPWGSPESTLYIEFVTVLRARERAYKGLTRLLNRCGEFISNLDGLRDGEDDAMSSVLSPIIECLKDIQGGAGSCVQGS